MKVHFLGATRTTTGSLYLLEVNGKRLLLECGLFQGHREETTQRNSCFPFDPRQIDAIVLSHAHIDHAGNLPNLVKQGYDGPIHCTDPTRDLCGVMLIDSAHIQEQDALFVSKWRAKKHQPPVEPLYRVPDAEKAVKQLAGHPYDQAFSPVDGVAVTFKDAGHILGSAQVVLDVQDRGRKFRWLFSGDVGRGADEILRDPVPVDNVDYLQIESTYGGREHAPRINTDETVCRLAGGALNQHGKVIIPAFSVGRTQQIVYVLKQITLNGCLPRVPIFVDSPLSTNATDIYRRHVECYNETIRKFLQENKDPFGMNNLTYIRDAGDSKKLNDRKEPLIIISASGMCEAGRIRHHLKNNIGDQKNLVLFIGYCAEGTLGDQIMKGKSPVNIFGDPYPVRAKVVSLDAYSGHADKNELMSYVENITGNIRKVFCIHGEESQCLAHAETLRQMKPKAEVLVPEYQQVVEI
ncbi:MAG TPA: MBL fold metallo-hydrolase [Candidatus Acidoferrales bacterium]|nr:MBL fold metallo-hydrolase [Candidatus Acidoferrales bacterium]